MVKTRKMQADGSYYHSKILRSLSLEAMLSNACGASLPRSCRTDHGRALSPLRVSRVGLASAVRPTTRPTPT